MNINSLKNKLLVSIMVLVLVGALFLPMSAGAESRANPNIKVTVAVDEPADVSGRYANITHNFTVNVENTGKEDLSNVNVTAVVYNATTDAMEFDLGFQIISSLGIMATTELHFMNWNPSLVGDYYILVNATANAYPVGGLAQKAEHGVNKAMVIADTMDVSAEFAWFTEATEWYMEGDMRIIKTMNYTVEVTVKNTGNTEMTGITVMAQIYDKGTSQVVNESSDAVASLGAGNETKVVLKEWNNTVNNKMHFIKFTVSSAGDSNAANDEYNMTFRVLDLTDVMPVGITSHMEAKEYNTAAQTFEAMIKNSGTLDLAEDFWVELNVSQGGSAVYLNTTRVDHTQMIAPGNMLEVSFDPVVLPAGGYGVMVTTLYSITGPDYNTTNNGSAVITFTIGNTPGFEVTINDPLEGKQEMMDITVNATIKNTGSQHTDDLGQINATLYVYDTNGTVDQADDVMVITPIVVIMSLAPGDMEYVEFSPQWTMIEGYNGTTFRIVVELTEVGVSTPHVSDEVEVEFPSNYGAAHFTITPGGATTEGAMISIDNQQMILTASGQYVFDKVMPGTYTASVSGVYGYEDNSTSTPILREITTPVDLTMEAMTNMGTLRGYVVDGMGMPVPFAAVDVVTTKANAPVTVTNASGGYDLGSVESGTVTVMAAKLGYISNSTDFTVGAAEDAMENITITLITAPVAVKVDTETQLGDTVTTNVSVDTDIMFFFEDAINVSTVASNIKLMMNGTTSTIDGSWMFTENNSVNFTFTPTSSLDTDMIYNVSIMSLLKKNDTAGGGNWYYDMDKTFQFHTAAPGVFDVMGKVVDGNNISVADVNVTSGTIWALTNSLGQFTLVEVPVGTGLVVKANDKMFHGYTQYKAGAGSQNDSVDVVDEDVTLLDDLVVIEQDLPITHALDMAADGVNVTVGTTITVTFPETVNATQVSENFALVIAGTSNPELGSWANSTDDKTYVFTPASDLANDEDYTFTVYEEIEGEDDDIMFWKDYDVDFHTEAKTISLGASIKVNGAAIDDSLEYAITSLITVVFTLKMNETAANAAITVTASSSTDNLVTNYSWSADGMTVTLEVALEKGKTYTVAVGTGAVSMAEGLGLASALSDSFTTESDTTPVSYPVKLYIDGEGKVELYKNGNLVASGTVSDGQVTLNIAAEDYAPGTYDVKFKGSGDYEDDEWSITIGTDDTISGPGTNAGDPRVINEKSKDEFPIWIILIIVVILVVVILIVMMTMKKKPEEEEGPAEEEGEEEAGEFECPACGALVSSEEKNCPECGEEFEEEEFKCPECGAPIESDATTCEACGAEFELDEDAEEGEEGEDEDYEVEGEEDEELEEGEEEEFEDELDEDEGAEEDDEEELEEEELSEEEGPEGEEEELEEELGDEDEDILEDEEEEKTD